MNKRLKALEANSALDRRILSSRNDEIFDGSQ
jgi:hypothetical protein